jgi:hypothetical protein
MSLEATRDALSADGRPIVLRYLAISAGLNLAWEIAQLPLYTIWRAGSLGEIVFAVVHCTLGDVLIAAGSFLLALLLVGTPLRRGRLKLGWVAPITVLLGLAYTLFSEWINVTVRGNWAYAPAMPVLPPLGTGLTPLLQWVAIPLLAFALARR